MKNKVTQEKLIPHVLWANQNKAAIQSSIDGGKTVVQIAQERGLPQATCRTILDGVGIKHGRAHKAVDTQAARETALFTVLLRIAKGIGVDHQELLPFVTE